MISISKVSPQGLGHYHSREDINEKPGHWLGKGAEEIQLTGDIKTEDLRSVAFGKAPNGIQIKGKRSKLVDGIYKNGTVAGNDAVFSPPKSASIIGCVGGDKRIAEFHQFASEKTIDRIERDCTFATVRTGGGRVREKTGNLIAAAFDHSTTRPDDNGVSMPQIHRHTIIFGSTKCSDKKWRRLENEEYFKHQKKDLRRFYIKELGEQMKEAGYGITYTREGLHFEIDGVSREQEMAFSSRTKQIEEELEQPLENASFKQKRIASLKTRNPKSDLSIEELTPKWNDIAKENGLQFDKVPGFIKTPDEIPVQQKASLGLMALTIQHKIKNKFKDLIGKVGEGRRVAYENAVEKVRVENESLKESYRLNHGVTELTEKDLEKIDESQVLEFLRPKHLSEKHWNELVVESGIDPVIATKSFESVNKADAIELVLGPTLGNLKGEASQYHTGAVKKILERHANLEEGGMWCPGEGGWGQLKPNLKPRIRDGKEVKYESPAQVPLGIMLPKGGERSWDEIKENAKVPLIITEGGKKAAATMSTGVDAIGLSGLYGGVKEGYLNHELQKFEWKDRKVYIVLDKDPDFKTKTKKDAAREIFKLGALLEYEGAEVVVGTIPGDPSIKIGLDDHLVAGRTLADLKWESLDSFAKNSRYLGNKYKKMNEHRLEKNLGVQRDGGVVQQLMPDAAKGLPKAEISSEPSKPNKVNKPKKIEKPIKKGEAGSKESVTQATAAEKVKVPTKPIKKVRAKAKNKKIDKEIRDSIER